MRCIGTDLPDDEYAAVGDLARGHDQAETNRGSDVASLRARGVDDDDIVRRSGSVVGAGVQRHALSCCIERGEHTETARDVGDKSALNAAVEIYETYLAAGPYHKASNGHHTHERC